jgi:twitching motility protein PilT
MIVNDPDLLPLGPKDDSGKPKPPQPEDFNSRVAESYDSIESLLAAREEAEEAEAKAKAAGETLLPFVKEAKRQDDAAPTSDAAKKQLSFNTGGLASDEDSPAPIGAISADLGRLSDARSVGSDSVTDYMNQGATPTSKLPDEEDGLARIPRGTAGGLALVDSPALHEPIPQSKGTNRLDETHINELLKMTLQYGASDLHITTSLPPMVRKDGVLLPLPFVCATEQDTQRIIYDILHTDQIEKYERTHELDFSYGVRGIGRFRFNVYKQRGSVAAAMRVIPNVIPTMEQLKLPPILRDLTRKHAGLVLVTGPTGSGKSTTIASMIDIINTERECHILTIEDPIEYLHTHKRCMVNQRELGGDTDTFNNALRASLREDPDVILVGEMRDLETIAAAITLAETGHLVFATLHTRCAAATIDRIVDVVPAHQQEQVRTQLATSVEAIVAQQLLPRPGGGRIAAIEIMIATAAIRNLIREGKTYQINSIIETGQQYGMQAMDRVLAELYRAGSVTYEEAATRAIDRENFQRLVKGY